MSFTSILLASFGAILVQSPIYLVYLVGLGLAIVRWNKHPRVSLLATLAFTGSLVTGLVITVLQVSLPYQLASSGTQLAGTYQVLGVCGSLIHAAFGSLLVAAIFGWRKTPDSTTQLSE